MVIYPNIILSLTEIAERKAPNVDGSRSKAQGTRKIVQVTEAVEVVNGKG